jgi:hypothetical protein
LASSSSNDKYITSTIKDVETSDNTCRITGRLCVVCEAYIAQAQKASLSVLGSGCGDLMKAVVVFCAMAMVYESSLRLRKSSLSVDKATGSEK